MEWNSNWNRNNSRREKWKHNVHPFIEHVLRTIIEVFDLKKQVPLWIRLAKLDSLNANQQILILSTDGGGQAISYLSKITHLRRIQIFCKDNLDLPQMRDFAFSAQTNGKSIQFFISRKNAENQYENLFTSIHSFIVRIANPRWSC